MPLKSVISYCIKWIFRLLRGMLHALIFGCIFNMFIPPSNGEGYVHPVIVLIMGATALLLFALGRMRLKTQYVLFAASTLLLWVLTLRHSADIVTILIRTFGGEE